MIDFNNTFTAIKPRQLLAATIVTVGLAMSAPASAASQCKGLDNEACDTSSSCSWVAGYERKDGRKVEAFCRAKAKQVATAVKAEQAAEQTQQNN